MPSPRTFPTSTAPALGTRSSTGTQVAAQETLIREPQLSCLQPEVGQGNITDPRGDQGRLHPLLQIETTEEGACLELPKEDIQVQGREIPLGTGSCHRQGCHSSTDHDQGQGPDLEVESVKG